VNLTGIKRLQGTVHGLVQGVGFRPFVYRRAREMGLTGWVQNSPQGVFFEAEGNYDALQRFAVTITQSKPPRSVIQDFQFSFIDPLGYTTFEIRRSAEGGAKTALILPDIAACPDCVREIFDPPNRRYRYPFTNCTNCGPRFTIIEDLPYDRANTSMKCFVMCPECSREYHDPLDRRFDAQPIACPSCGPRLALWDEQGTVLAERDDALLEAAKLLRKNKVIALKGLGGFQLCVDARSEEAVARLRTRKQREEKPFALMVPSLASTRELCQVSELEEQLLLSPEAPIVLLLRKERVKACAPSIAPGNPYLGVMLPYTPLHHLLMAELGFPIVATSGNLSDEPICIDEHEALGRLSEIADCFLVHDRPIFRHMDDSVVRVVSGRELLLRRARGYAPAPVQLRKPLPTTIAVGGHLKNTVAVSVGRAVFLSQHLGDLATAQAHAAFLKSAADLPRLYGAKLDAVTCDLHPEYLSTKYAESLSGPPYRVQHHWAHVLACMAEHGLEPPVLGVSWDGTGYGLDGTVWGGEFLASDGDLASFQRVAHLRTFRLPGGEAAVKQPCRSALGILFEIWGRDGLAQGALAPIRSFVDHELALLAQMLEKRVNAPITSSAGRLFDAVAALIGLRQRVSFEGQAAMELEFAIQPNVFDEYPFAVRLGEAHIVDWQPMIEQIVLEIRQGVTPGIIAAKFHNTLASMVCTVARKFGRSTVVLTGGCFQNRALTERCVQRLSEDGLHPYWHQRVPPNDGGIALGQIVAAAASYTGQSHQSKGGFL
jgi:hydrogenase maturation protein HypF